MSAERRVGAVPTSHGEVVPSPYPPGWLVGQLPVGMRDDDMLVRFTTIFERLGAGLRAAADGIEHAADPTVTTPPMLGYLASWLGYRVIDESLPIDRQREIVGALGRALPLRGTPSGLRAVLEAVTGGPVDIREPGAVLDGEGAVPPTGSVEVRVTTAGHLRERELIALVRDEVPAHLEVEVIFADPSGTEPS